MEIPIVPYRGQRKRKKAAEPIQPQGEFGWVSNSQQLLDKAYGANGELILNPIPEHPAVSFLSHIDDALSREPAEIFEYIQTDPFFSIYLKLRYGTKDRILFPPSFDTRTINPNPDSPYDVIDQIRASGDFSLLTTRNFGAEQSVRYILQKQERAHHSDPNAAKSAVTSLATLHRYIKREPVPSTINYEIGLGIVEDAEYNPLEEMWDKLKGEFFSAKKSEGPKSVLAKKYLAILGVLGLDRGMATEIDPPAKDKARFKPGYECESGYGLNNVRQIAKIIAEGLKVGRYNILFNSKTKTKPEEKKVLRVRGKADYAWPDNTDITRSVLQLLGRNGQATRPGCIQNTKLDKSTRESKPEGLDLKAQRVKLGEPKKFGFWNTDKPGVDNEVCRNCVVFQEFLCPRVDYKNELQTISELRAIKLVDSIDRKIHFYQKNFNWVIVTD